MKKADIILIASGLIISVLFVLFLLFQNKSDKAYVYYDGEQTMTINLNKDNTITIKNGDDINILEVKDGSISVVESNCPNGDCIKMGKINKNKQSIVCLPHKLSVTVVNDDSEYDFIIE